MSTWDDRYLDRLRMLVQMLPQFDKERRFALKGGTAINLFEHDLPRLSVDIDLAWLPVQDFATDAAAIGESLATLAERLRAPPLKLQVQASATADAGAAHRLIASRGRTRVQIETTPVMRGTCTRCDACTSVPRWSAISARPKPRSCTSQISTPARWRLRCRASIRAICSTSRCCWTVPELTANCGGRSSYI